MRSENEIKRILLELESSGETQSAFCRERGIAVSTLQYWLRRKRRKAGPGDQELPLLMEVEISGADREGSRGLEYEIVVRAERVLRVRCGFNANEVATLVGILGRF